MLGPDSQHKTLRLMNMDQHIEYLFMMALLRILCFPFSLLHEVLCCLECMPSILI